MNPYHRGVPTRTPTATSYLIMPWYRKLKIRFSMWRLRRSAIKNGGTVLSFGVPFKPNRFYTRNIMGNIYNDYLKQEPLTEKDWDEYCQKFWERKQ